MINKNGLVIILITLIQTLITNAQVSEKQYNVVDSIVYSWNSASTPGGVVGIMEHGELKFVKGFGLASLDYNIPCTDSTLFNIGSISKQFTAMGIVKLHLKGKLSIDDNIRRYLPELPDFGHEITVRHLMHHTSGLRDIHSVLRLAGWRRDDPRSNEDLFEIMKNQKELNFNPGDEYMYSNTNYIFMSMIIEVVTGEIFEVWMKNNVFVPLGLFDTYVERNATNVVKGNATSYRKQENNNYTRAVEYWNYTGSGNVHTNVKDLLTWQYNFINPSDEWKRPFKLLQTKDTLNNGKLLNYAFGVEIDTINGISRIFHGGGVGGFGAFLCTYPNLGLSLAVLTNYSSSNPYNKINSISKKVIPKLANKTNQDRRAYNDDRIVPADNLKQYEGDYWFDAYKSYRKIYLKKDTLWYYRKKGDESPLQYIGNNEFIIMPKAMWKTKFVFEEDSVVSMIVESKRFVNDFVPFVPVEITPSYLSEFVGTYYSPELETYYDLRIQGDSVIAHHPKHGYIKLDALVKKDQFIGEAPLQKIVFERNPDSKITGMRVSYDRVKNLWLEKVN